jgi:hypothetical protein
VRSQHPALDDVCDYETVRQTARPGEILQELLDDPVRTGGALSSVVACPPDDGAALECVSDWIQSVRRPDVPLAVRLSRGGGLVSLTSDRARADGYRIVPFGWFDEAACESLLREDERERMAKLVQVQFKRLAEGQGRRREVDRAVADWREMTHEDYKDSNRQQVDHIPIKLRAIGCELAHRDDPRPEATFSRDEVEILAEMEHARWVAERRLAGWTYADGPKDERARTSPNLAAWEALSESIKDYDRDSVMNIGALAREAGRKLCRAAAPGPIGRSNAS